jgi:plasmid maintenance system antidote protein VapI
MLMTRLESPAEVRFRYVERWKPVTGWEGFYEVSNLVRVKSLERRIWVTGKGGTWHWRIIPEKILKPSADNDGYLLVVLCKNGVGKTCKVHRLVLEAFVGPCPDGMECRHLNGNPSDSRLENLRWGTPGENQADKVLHGTDNKGSKNSQAKLTKEQVLEIREKYVTSGATHRKLAEKYGVAVSVIGNIVCGKTWKDCGGPITRTRRLGNRLTEKQVLEIRERYVAGDVSQKNLAEQYGTTQTNISDIVNRKSWKCIR